MLFKYFVGKFFSLDLEPPCPQLLIPFPTPLIQMMSDMRRNWFVVAKRLIVASTYRRNKNEQSIKREKKQEPLRKQDWKRRPRNWWKKSNVGRRRKNNARRIWLINSKWTVLLP